MKTLELKLKKDVLIVEIPRLADYEFINKECKYIKVGNEEIKLNASTLDKFEFLCKGSELTEEIASELVDEGSYFKTFKNYITNDNHKRNQLKFAIGSFISAVERKGFLWIENNLSIGTSVEDYKKWQEAEEKTFKNPLIFVKNA